jgi:superfamily I DNA/RNA helicase
MWRLLDDQPGKWTIRYCCFNKAVADEFQEGCPPGVEVGTMHRFGLLALAGACSARIDAAKTYTLLDGVSDGKRLARYARRSVSLLVGLAKNQGYRPDRPTLEDDLATLAWVHDVSLWGRDELILAMAARVLARSAECLSLIDFDDMLWLPVIHDLRFPGVDQLYIDEAQDLNPVQHELAERLSGTGRTIVVGDPYQAIYGWRGAATDSIARLRDKLGAKTLPLTVTWRCPTSHVALARRIVPDLQAAPGAILGELHSGARSLVEHAVPGDMVICRTNAPIVQACLQTVASGVPAYVRGRAIGAGLAAIVKRDREILAAATTAELVRAIHAWRARELTALAAKEGVEQKIEQAEDQAACLDALAKTLGTSEAILARISELFDETGSAQRVTFSSIHRAKGSEADRVTVIQIPYTETRDRDRPPAPWEVQQRKNLEYVALTRSRRTLTLVA